MASRYIVCVKIDDYVRIFGTWQRRGNAEAFAEAVNVKVGRVEEKQQAEWAALPPEQPEMAPDPLGHAYVLTIHKPLITPAVEFGLGQT